MTGPEYIDVGQALPIVLLVGNLLALAVLIQQAKRQFDCATAALADFRAQRHCHLLFNFATGQHAAGLIDGDIFQLPAADGAIEPFPRRQRAQRPPRAAKSP